VPFRNAPYPVSATRFHCDGGRGCTRERNAGKCVNDAVRRLWGIREGRGNHSQNICVPLLLAVNGGEFRAIYCRRRLYVRRENALAFNGCDSRLGPSFLLKKDCCTPIVLSTGVVLLARVARRLGLAECWLLGQQPNLRDCCHGHGAAESLGAKLDVSSGQFANYKSMSLDIVPAGNASWYNLVSLVRLEMLLCRCQRRK
jgi:hypothetical protein